MPNTQHRVRGLIREVRTRWRRRALVQGAAIALGVFALWGTGLLLLHGLVSPGVWLAALISGVLIVSATVAWYVVRPAIRPISDRDVALYVEERLPVLEDRLNAAVEIDDPAAARAAHGILVDHLVDDAAERARVLSIGSVVSRRRERPLLAGSVLMMLLFLVVGYRSLDELRFSAASGTLIPKIEPYMTVDPGNAEIEQGDAQSIIVTLRDETTRDVVLHYRSADDTWRQTTMQAAVGEPSFLHEFLDVQAPIQYFVEHEGHRSDAYDISLYTFPAVTRVDLTYQFPEYTGRAPERVENTGDVLAVKGTFVTIDVHTNGRAETGALVLDDGSTIDLTAAENGRFRGRLQLEKPGFYSIRLTDSEDKQNKFPEEYRITPVDDLPPRVTVTIPQRDVRANAVEEVLVAARAEDDFGIKDLRLRFAVNADAEQAITLKPAETGRPLEVDGEHLFFLEDYTLEPGDVIAYYVEAEDFSGAAAEATDMYFIEVIPFDQEYTQVARGGGAQGGQGQSGIVMSQQQIIAATWKLHRERDRMPADEHASSRDGLAQAQDNLRRNIEERISQTAFSLELQRNEDTRQIANHLRAAASAMQEAVVDLRGDRLREALQPEREALNHLLKADAMNRERQIALNRNGQQGGGGGGSTEERMTELMDLELDISKDKYEIMQESAPGAGATPEMNETLQKLQELARRQENLADQSRQNLQGEDRRRQVERLQRDQQDLQRQAQALAQQIRQMSQQNGSSSGQTQQQLDRAAERMREAEQALREGNVEQARARQQQALNELERVTRDMQMASGQSERQRLQEMDRTLEAMREQEERLDEAIRRTTQEAAGGRIDPNALDELAEQRRAIREGLERLERDAAALAGGQDQDLASAAREIQRGIRRNALDENLQESEDALRRGWLDNARRRQDVIRRGMDELDEAMQALDGQLPVGEEEQLARALESVRELERDLRALEQQAAANGGDPSASESTQGQASSEASSRQGSSPGGSQAQAQAPDGRAARADAARREARLARAREQLSRLEEALQDSPNSQQLGGIRRALGRADNPNAPMSAEEAAAFFDDNVFAPLSQLEEALIMEIDRLAMERKLRGSRPDDVPAAYRDLVERYYEALSN